MRSFLTVDRPTTDMLSLALEDFMIELKDGSISNVGAPRKSGTVKLYDVTETEVREFGDERVKLVFEDDANNEVHVAIEPEVAQHIGNRIETLEDESPVFE